MYEFLHRYPEEVETSTRKEIEKLNTENFDDVKELTNFLLDQRENFLRKGLAMDRQKYQTRAESDKNFALLRPIENSEGKKVFDLSPIHKNTTELVFCGSATIEQDRFNTAIKSCTHLKRIVFSYFDEDIDDLSLPANLEELDLGQIFGMTPAYGLADFWSPVDGLNLFKQLPKLPNSLKRLRMSQEMATCVKLQLFPFSRGSKLETFEVGPGVVCQGLSLSWFSQCKNLKTVKVHTQLEPLTYARERGWIPKNCIVEVLS